MVGLYKITETSMFHFVSTLIATVASGRQPATLSRFKYFIAFSGFRCAEECCGMRGQVHTAPKLQHFDLTDCTKISQDSKDAFTLSRPNVNIGNNAPLFPNLIRSIEN